MPDLYVIQYIMSIDNEQLSGTVSLRLYHNLLPVEVAMKVARVLLPSFLLLAIAILVFGRHPLLPRAQTIDDASTPCCGLPDETAPREVDFPYYSLREGFNSTLLLVSDWPKPLDFVVALHSLTGQTTLAPGMTINPQQKLSIDLGTLLTGLGADVAGDFAEGSVSVYFNGAIMPLAGQLTVSNPERGLNMEVEMVDNAPGHGLLPKQLNGLWWGIGAGRDARVMVSNTSGNTVEADIFLDFAGERHTSDPLTFKPHETKVLSVSKLLGDLKTSPAAAPEGGMTVIPRGAVPALIAQGKIMDVANGFSTTLDFPLPEVQRSKALHASGVPIGLPSKDSPYAGAGVFIPHVIVRNLTSAPQSVVITLEYPGEKEPQQTPLPAVALGPYATVDVALDSAFGMLPLPLPFCSIRIQYSGAPGSVIGEVSSVESKGDLVIDSRLANEGDGWAGSGGNPWHLDEETESILFLTNMSDRPAPIGFHVQANGVHYYVDDLRLEPHETRAIDLRKLRDAQKPDFYKHKIPADATDGSVVWVRVGNVPVMGQMVVLRRHKGLASNYHCAMCQCPAYLLPWALVVTPSGATINVNSSLQFNATASYMDCYGNVLPLTGHQEFGWWPDPPGVATVSANGYATGVSGGTTTINALFIDCGRWKYDYFYDCCNCMYYNSPVGATPLTVWTFAVSLSPSAVQPDGIGGSPTTTVTVQTSPAVSGRSVSLQDVRVANTAGHVNHPLPNSNVAGTFSPGSGTTDSTGKFQSTYRATIFAGNQNIRATMGGTTKSATLQVSFSGIGELSPGANYTHVGQIPGIHEQNWFGASNTRNGLVATANAFAAQYPGSTVPYNDLSLPWGGKFDGNAGNWAGGHAEHRVGRNCDVNVCSWSQDRKDYLAGRFYLNGAQSPLLDECATNNTWHVTW
jgi:hypothetical protein